MGYKTFKHKVINDELQFVYFEKCSNFSIPNNAYKNHQRAEELIN